MYKSIRFQLVNPMFDLEVKNVIEMILWNQKKKEKRVLDYVFLVVDCSVSAFFW